MRLSESVGSRATRGKVFLTNALPAEGMTTTARPPLVLGSYSLGPP
ncbi:MAG TPA: hypothetical protein VJV79_29355 [Polyangiaceae bacterium]|nr:hypothetical protein [Polyangiaceae bacterium]